MKKIKRHSLIRRGIQLASACFLNGYATGFLKGSIFTKNTKAVCVPVLNCYSCPGALGACPIGSLQAMLCKNKGRFPFYVLGTLILFGVLCGRLLCGFICPFGFVQDLLYKIPVKKIHINKKIDKPLRYLKYLVLLLFVVLLPLLIKGKTGVSSPWFCKYICPAGTLEGGIPLVASNKQLRSLTGVLFGWKTALLIIIIVASVFTGRFFCRYICPLGAFYSFFNKFGFYRMGIDKSKCTDCKTCEKVCIMAVDVTKNINGTECVRCGKCAASCPSNAIKTGYVSVKNK